MPSSSSSCKCIAVGCFSKHRTSPDLKFFRIPTDPERCRKWLMNCGRYDLLHHTSAYLHTCRRVCSKHFHRGMYANGRFRRLVKDALPTVFKKVVPVSSTVSPENQALLQSLDGDHSYTRKSTPGSRRFGHGPVEGLAAAGGESATDHSCTEDLLGAEDPAAEKLMSMADKAVQTSRDLEHSQKLRQMRKKIHCLEEKVKRLRRRLDEAEGSIDKDTEARSSASVQNSQIIRQALPDILKLVNHQTGSDASSAESGLSSAERYIRTLAVGTKLAELASQTTLADFYGHIRILLQLKKHWSLGHTGTKLICCSDEDETIDDVQLAAELENINLHSTVVQDCENNAQSVLVLGSGNGTTDGSGTASGSCQTDQYHLLPSLLTLTAGNPNGTNCVSTISGVAPRKTVKCSTCRRKFRSLFGVKVHKPFCHKTSASVNKVGSEDKSTCSMCQLNFKSPSGLRQHQQKAHKPYNSVRNCAPANSDTESADESGVLTSRPNQSCDKTGDSGNIAVITTPESADVLQTVSILSNGDGLLVPNTDTSPSKAQFVCSVCGKQFRLRQSMVAHMVTHSGERPFACRSPGCTKRFGQTSTRNFHERTHSNLRPYICTQCGQSYKQPSYLKIHGAMVHGTDVRPHHCPLCDNAFKTSKSLALHMQNRHSDERSQACDECPKQFKTRQQLRRHHRTVHLQQRPYLCSICQKTFSQPGNLKTHLRVHTGEKPFLCTFCGQRFAHSRTLKAHLITH